MVRKVELKTLSGKTESSKVWCVRKARSWCAMRAQSARLVKRYREGVEKVPTTCGRPNALPFRFEQCQPTCVQCLERLAARRGTR